MRVLHVHNAYRQPGGEDQVVAAERALLREAGHSVDPVDAANSERALPAALSLLGAPWNPVSALRMGRLEFDHPPDVAHVHNTWFTLTPSSVWALARRLPVIMTTHNYRLSCANAMLFRDGAPCEVCVGRSPWPAVRYRCYHDSAPQSALAAATISLNRALDTWGHLSRILVLSEYSRDIIVASGVAEDKVTIHPNFVRDPGEREQLPSESQTVLFVGRLSQEKGARYLLEAWRASAPNGLHLLVVGDGPERQAVQAMEVPGVQFAGRLPPIEVERLMLSSRALVFPSLWAEGQPMVLTEALASGLPAIATRHPNLESVTGNGALSVDTRDQDAFIDALGRLEEEDFVNSLGRAARTRYLDRFTSEKALQRLEDVYRSATT